MEDTLYRLLKQLQINDIHFIYAALPSPHIQQKAAHHMLELQAAILIEYPHHALFTMINKETIGFTLRQLGKYSVIHKGIVAGSTGGVTVSNISL